MSVSRVRAVLLFGTTLCGIGALPARAQDAAVSDIVVTAQKRAENVQDVPLAVTVVGAQQLENASVRDFSELTKVAPSLTIRPSDAAQNASIQIRGIGTFAFSPGVEFAVAIQIDDVPVAFQARAFADLSDVERIEVLRGPQSTLYGKNASAGLINIVTKSPGDKFAARFALTATTDDEQRLEMSASGPVTDTLGVSFGGSYRYFDGNVKNIFTGDTVNGSENIVVRSKLVWKPTPDLAVDVNLSYMKVDSDPTYVYRTLSPNARLRGNTSQTPAVIMPGITPGPNNLQVALNEQPFFNSTDFAKSLRVSWTLPNDLTLMSITAHDDYDSKDHIDSDRTISPIISNFADGTFGGKAFTQELRLVSPGNQPFMYTLGLFYADTDLTRGYKRGPAFSLAEWNATSESRQWAAFGQGDWEFAEGTTLTVGVRGQREKIGYTFNDLRTNPISRFSGGATDNVMTYRAGLKHEFDNDIMIFGSYARGHKGQAYDLTTGFNALRASLGPLMPEKSDAFEAGLRAQFFDRRVTFNLTAFHVDYRDLQTQSIEDIQGIPTFRLTNVGKSRTKGVEVDLAARPVDGLSLAGGLAYTDATFVDFPTAACYPGQTAAQGCTGTPGRQDLSGASLSVPKWKANVSWDYAFPVGGVEGLIGGNYTWQSKTASTDPSTIIGAYGVTNITAGIRAGNVTVRAFVNNLFDKHYPVNIGNQYSNFGNQAAIDFLPGRDFKRYGGLRLSADF
ncbi:TonB-dependent receptor [Sphingobium sp. CR2-8]|uniref:TonB-dependent receptor n=1 Tax=Sphingobium sp. CR2-8 TaxID=1306534 RepID=UPI002DC00F56|nr:TonB-dependent receptor [Sphingobium sp. CR2-8]MEC3911866.1 TonB-dependent receptor [Sphingobium sp. CR2-8]